jgi:hypothetical protein
LGNRPSGRRLLDQLELQLEELETSAAEDEGSARTVAPAPTPVRSTSPKLD